ncbi:MAG TPA: nucleotidyltransferase family protein [Candidatus Baltobacteraceae bacterium]|nr:nucleotidyltransferase family protein [Candidatus Baltobacteraceae bacterium]
MRAVILVGGQGKRLRPLTDDKPKTLVEVGGKPIIEWEINWLKKCGIDSFVILAGYMKDKLMDYLDEGRRFGVEIEYVVETEPLGTGGAIKYAQKALADDGNFLVINGDNIWNMDISKMALRPNSVAALALNQLRSTYGVVRVDDNKVVGFDEKPILPDHWMNAGIYLMTQEIFDFLPDNGAIETLTFPQLVRADRLDGIRFPGAYWRGADNVKDVEEISADLKAGKVFD